jgi:hypothetical protein
MYLFIYLSICKICNTGNEMQSKHHRRRWPAGSKWVKRYAWWVWYFRNRGRQRGPRWVVVVTCCVVCWHFICWNALHVVVTCCVVFWHFTWIVLCLLCCVACWHFTGWNALHVVFTCCVVCWHFICWNALCCMFYICSPPLDVVVVVCKQVEMEAWAVMLATARISL